MAKKDFTNTSKLLINLFNLGDVLSYVIGTPYTLRKIWNGKPSDFRSTLFQLQKRGVIKIVDKNNERFVSLTKKGQLEALFCKARLASTPKSWDKKWRMIVFDIPEESQNKRKQLRELLYKNSFVKIQDSVYVSPWPLHRDAIIYLKKSRLIEYIRIAKIEELDNDNDLRKQFNLR